jgi:hypothetical protein
VCSALSSHTVPCPRTGLVLDTLSWLQTIFFYFSPASHPPFVPPQVDHFAYIENGRGIDWWSIRAVVHTPTMVCITCTHNAPAGDCPSCCCYEEKHRVIHSYSAASSRAWVCERINTHICSFCLSLCNDLSLCVTRTHTHTHTHLRSSAAARQALPTRGRL